MDFNTDLTTFFEQTDNEIGNIYCKLRRYSGGNYEPLGKEPYSIQSNDEPYSITSQDAPGSPTNVEELTEHIGRPRKNSVSSGNSENTKATVESKTPPRTTPRTPPRNTQFNKINKQYEKNSPNRNYENGSNLLTMNLGKDLGKCNECPEIKYFLVTTIDIEKKRLSARVIDTNGNINEKTHYIVFGEDVNENQKKMANFTREIKNHCQTYVVSALWSFEEANKLCQFFNDVGVRVPPFYRNYVNIFNSVSAIHHDVVNELSIKKPSDVNDPSKLFDKINTKTVYQQYNNWRTMNSNFEFFSSLVGLFTYSILSFRSYRSLANYQSYFPVQFLNHKGDEFASYINRVLNFE